MINLSVLSLTDDADGFIILIISILLLTFITIYIVRKHFKHEQLKLFIENQDKTLNVYHVIINNLLDLYEVKFRLDQTITNQFLAEDYQKLKNEFITDLKKQISDKTLDKQLKTIFKDEEAYLNYAVVMFDKEFWIRYIQAPEVKADTVIQG